MNPPILDEEPAPIRAGPGFLAVSPAHEAADGDVQGGRRNSKAEDAAGCEIFNKSVLKN
jgi:hypothetical protein